jgi:hypothetical protein
MIKRATTSNSIWVKTMEGKSFQLLICNMMYGINNGAHTSLITDRDGVIYTYPYNVGCLIKLFIGFNLYQIHKFHVINLNFISRQVNHHFSYKQVIMMDGEPLAVAARVATIVKRFFKKLKRKCLSWYELVLWKT